MLVKNSVMLFHPYPVTLFLARVFRRRLLFLLHFLPFRRLALLVISVSATV